MAQARSSLKVPVWVTALACAFALSGLVAMVGAVARAQAGPSGWTVCNQTSYILETATGRPEGKAVLVAGWLRLLPGECRTAAAAPLTRGVHYIYART